MAQPAIDGRRARAERHKEAVAHALLAIMRETADLPTVDQVAARANVSKRTVYRLFEDLTTLHHAAVEIQRGEVLRRFPPPMPEPEPMATRIERVVEHRAALFEFVMPIRMVAERIRHMAPAIEVTLQNDREAFRLHVDMMFAEHLEATFDDVGDRLHAIELATSFHAWRALRITQGCSIARAKRITKNSVSALVLATKP